MSDEFYLHEDEWGMVAVMPAENMDRTREVSREAQAFGDEHNTGAGWTDMYVIPEEEHPIFERGIKLEELREVVAGRLAEASRVMSGYSTYREDVGRGYAFGQAYGNSGALYGWSENGVIMALNVILPGGKDTGAVDSFALILDTLGQKYALILVDWWSNELIDLRENGALRSYLAKQEEYDGD